MFGMASLCRLGCHVSVRHARRGCNQFADALAAQASVCRVGGGWEVFDCGLLRVLAGEEGCVLHVRVMSDASVANGVAGIGVLASVRYVMPGDEGSPEGWEQEELGWLGGSWGGWRPFIVGVERVEVCSVPNAELLGALAAINLVHRVVMCLAQNVF